MSKDTLRNTARVLVTLITVAAAIYFGRSLWTDYMGKPWTRDGRVRAIIVAIAPDVSGIITKLDLKDNQPVRKGDLLFTIDTERYKLALDEASLAVATARASVTAAQDNVITARHNIKTQRDNLRYLKLELTRRRALRDSAAGTQEELDRAESAVTAGENAVIAAEDTVTAAQNAVTIAEAGHRHALSAVAAARLDIARSEVRSPVNGHITNLQIDAGDYATAGKPMLAIVNSDSLYIAAYFEETKLRHIHENAPVTIKLMGYKEPVLGYVESIAPAIVDRDNTAGDDLVANVNPTFAWVRLAQRIPVRIAIAEVPENVRLIAGMTATIIVEDTPDDKSAATIR
ncbi:MAG: HlyD family secretion protein [Opitutaceae bacterium]|jgi:multidrug resistance efflux pump|nr:HlyD family secretion protein [Opitutaceae bacterium]